MMFHSRSFKKKKQKINTQFNSMKLFSKYAIHKWLSCYINPAADVEFDPCTTATNRHDLLVETTKTTACRFKSEEIDNAMAKSTVIGEGGFSTVYLANLPRTPSVAAFKVQRSSERLDRAFLQELDILLRVNHRNIVPLLGYCIEKDECVLVLDYVSNGTLHDRLHGGRKPTEVLSWSRRMSIAFQLASALHYLHEGCDLQIIHGDIKSTNVLLDEENDVKLCDFGSARKGFSATVDRTCRSTMVGSPGYVDPYYLRTGMITKKSDVYSFGVVLFELVTGLEAFCSEKGQMLTAVVRQRLAVDPKMCGEYDLDEALSMAEIARRCINVEQPGLRPSMAEVLRIMREKMPFVV